MTRRMFSPEYLEPGACRGGSGWSGREMGPTRCRWSSAQTGRWPTCKVIASELKNAAGGTLPAESVSIFGMNPQPLGDISSLGEGRIVGSEMIEMGGGNSWYGDWSPPKTRALVCFAPETLDNRAAAAAVLGRIQYFDWITSALPERIAADSCQPYWLSVKVPADAAPGLYRGAVRVAGPDFPAGHPALEQRGILPGAGSRCPWKWRCLDWQVPDPHDFQTLVAIEQSPYGVAKQYQDPALVRQALGADRGQPPPAWAGGQWPMVRARAPRHGIRQSRRLDDQVDAEEGRIARVRLRHARPLLGPDCQELRQAAASSPLWSCTGFRLPRRSKVLDEASGKEERVNLGPDVPGREKYWQPFARFSLSAISWPRDWIRRCTGATAGTRTATRSSNRCCANSCRRSSGVAAPMMPTYRCPAACRIPVLPYFTRRLTRPAPGLARSRPVSEAYYKVVENIQSFLIGGESQKGWKVRDQILLSTPRVDSGAIVVNGTSTPWVFRIFPERAIFTGYRGTGRMGGDYWAKSYHDGCGHYGGAPGFSIMKSLWPGPNGAEPSARFEAMIEGLQELEARIFVEQTLDRGILTAAQARYVTEQLARHYKGTFAVGLGWQARSQAMYQLASEVAAVNGLDVDQSEVAIHIEARAQTAFRIKLRNWTGKPRRWKAEGSEKWIVPARTAGVAKCSEET